MKHTFIMIEKLNYIIFFVLITTIGSIISLAKELNGKDLTQEIKL